MNDFSLTRVNRLLVIERPLTDWQVNAEGCPEAKGALHANRCAVPLHNVAYDREPKTSPFHFGGKERLEDPRLIFWTDPVSIIHNLDQHSIFFESRANGNYTLRRVNCIDAPGQLHRLRFQVRLSMLARAMRISQTESQIHWCGGWLSMAAG